MGVWVPHWLAKVPGLEVIVITDAQMMSSILCVRCLQEMEIGEVKFGFIPNSQDQQAWRFRRRYRLLKGTPCPQLVLVHYTRGQAARAYNYSRNPWLASHGILILTNIDAEKLIFHSHQSGSISTTRTRIPSPSYHRLRSFCCRRTCWTESPTSRKYNAWSDASRSLRNADEHTPTTSYGGSSK